MSDIDRESSVGFTSKEMSSHKYAPQRSQPRGSERILSLYLCRHSIQKINQAYIARTRSEMKRARLLDSEVLPAQALDVLKNCHHLRPIRS